MCEAHRRHGHVSPMNHDSRGSQIRKSTVTESTQGHQAGCGRTPETGENTRSLLILEMRKAEGHRCPSHREPCRRTAPRLGHPPPTVCLALPPRLPRPQAGLSSARGWAPQTANSGHSAGFRGRSLSDGLLSSPYLFVKYQGEKASITPAPTPFGRNPTNVC